MNIYLLATAFTLIGVLSAAASDPRPTTNPAAPMFGEMRVATLAPSRFIYVELETSFATLPKDVGPAIAKIETALNNAKVWTIGGSIFRYPPIQDMNAKFTLQIGFKVPPDAKAPAGTKVIDLPAFKCATLNFTGSMKHMKDAYGHLFNAMKKEGLRPAGESREAYFYFEDADSENDVTQIQIAVE